MRDNWSETNIGEVLLVSIGGIWGGDIGTDEIDVQVYRQTEFNDNGRLSMPSDAIRSVSVSQLKSRRIEFGDVLLQKSAGTPTLPGRVVRVPQGIEDDATCSNFLQLVRADPNKCIPEFLFWELWFRHKSGGAFEFQRGTNIKNLDLKQYFSQPLQLPPIHEQRRIVDVVSSVDAYIDALQQHADAARCARDAVLHELLTAAGDDWTETTLDAISLNLNSRRIPITKSDRNVGPFPYYGASGIVDYVDNFIFDECTLLISEDGANLTARSTPIAFSAQGKYWVNNHAHVLRFEDIATQTYVEFYLNAVRIDEWVTGAAQPKLNQKSLNEIPIPLPPIAEQKRIVEIVSSMDEVIQAAERAVVEAKSLRSALLSDLLSGEHEIPVSYDALLEAA